MDVLSYFHFKLTRYPASPANYLYFKQGKMILNAGTLML
jgi:hypothetical protein